MLSEGEDSMSLDLRLNLSTKGTAQFVQIFKDNVKVGNDYAIADNGSGAGQAQFSVADCGVGTQLI